MNHEKIIIDREYATLIQDLKATVQTAQLRAHRAVNTELIRMYWQIGKTLLEKQKVEAWGSKYLDQISRDLAAAFPGVRGFSTTNLKNMRTFAKEYPNINIGHQLGDQLLPWRSMVDLLSKVKDKTTRRWYIQKALQEGWSRNVLNMMIKSDLYSRQADAPKINNFKETLPALQSDMANDLFKDPYNFEFLNIDKDAKEREIENALVDHIREFLIRLGKGFAFLGSQYKIVVGGDEFFIDMLFFNTELNCHVVIELKAGKFSPAHSGQLKFYITAVNKLIKKEHHAATIGICLCESKNEVVAEFSLDGMNEPMVISQYELGAALTQHLKMVRERKQLLVDEPEEVTC